MPAPFLFSPLAANDGTVNSVTVSTTAEVSEMATGVSIDSITPNLVITSSSADVTITGSGFQAGASVSLEDGSYNLTCHPHLSILSDGQTVFSI